MKRRRREECTLDSFPHHLDARIIPPQLAFVNEEKK
jgi:hypothetical protein